MAGGVVVTPVFDYLNLKLESFVFFKQKTVILVFYCNHQPSLFDKPVSSRTLKLNNIGLNFGRPLNKSIYSNFGSLGIAPTQN